MVETRGPVVADRHAGPVRQAGLGGEGVCTVPWFGVFGTIDHEVPFHVSARLAGEGPEVAAAEPTALHVVALKQSTPVSLLLDVAEVSGTVAVIAHCVPFQLSIRFWERGPVRLTWPTAWQKDTPAHDTELSETAEAGRRLGCRLERPRRAVPQLAEGRPGSGRGGVAVPDGDAPAGA